MPTGQLSGDSHTHARTHARAHMAFFISHLPNKKWTINQLWNNVHIYLFSYSNKHVVICFLAWHDDIYKNNLIGL